MTGPLARLRDMLTPPSLHGSRLSDRFAGTLDPALRLLFEDPSAGRLVADRDGRVVRASARLQRMIGTALDLLPGTPLRLLFAEADRDVAWNEIMSLLQGPAGVAALRPLTVQLIGDVDAPVTACVTCSPLAGLDGTVDGVLLTAHDVSSQSRLEAQLAQSQRLHAAGQLAGGVAHDFNNLLTAVIGGADAIATRNGLDEETAEDVAVIRASAERGAELVRNLLAFGRQQTFQPRVLALNMAVDKIAAILRRLLGTRVRLELALEQPEQFVRVDPTALDQVVVNLAVNARDAMPEGGTLTLHTGKLTLHRPLPRGAETIPAGSYVMVEVQDTGTGIPAEALPHIFEPFFTTRRDAGGSGLGLSTVHGIVRQSDGFLAVESASGQGTRMRVYLPAWRGEPAADPVAALVRPAVPAAGGAVQPSLPFPEVARPPRGAVLLVDDEDVVRRVAERALIRQGWSVLAAPNAEAALELLRADRPHLAAVVSDQVMPGMDGTDLLQAVRQLLGCPSLPAILVSGYAAEELRDKVAAASGGGDTRFLAKPYDIKDLAAALAEIVV